MIARSLHKKIKNAALLGFVAFFFCFLGTLSHAQAETAQAIKAEGAYARATPAKISVIYARLHNQTDQDITLTAVETDAAGKVELHIIVNGNGVLRMREHKEGFTIPANGHFDLIPNGPHIMLYDLTNPLKEKERFDATLVFNNGSKQTIPVVVRPISAQPDWLD